jgi:flagellar basal body-associated protein FliL
MSDSTTPPPGPEMPAVPPQPGVPPQPAVPMPPPAPAQPGWGIPGSSAPPVPPPRKSRKKVLYIVLGVVVVIIAAFVVLAIVLHPGKYSDHGVAFNYPASWKHGQTQFAAQSGSAVWSESFSPGSSSTEGVTVSQYALNADVSSVSPDAVKAEVTTLVGNLAQQLNGSIVGDLKPAQVGGMQGYEVTINATIEGQALTVDLTLLFKGKAQYNIGCQATSANQDEISKGCTQVKDTFALK